VAEEEGCEPSVPRERESISCGWRSRGCRSPNQTPKVPLSRMQSLPCCVELRGQRSMRWRARPAGSGTRCAASSRELRAYRKPNLTQPPWNLLPGAVGRLRRVGGGSTSARALPSRPHPTEPSVAPPEPHLGMRSPPGAPFAFRAFWPHRAHPMTEPTAWAITSRSIGTRGRLSVDQKSGCRNRLFI
jgi:hypothetical protein